MGIHDYKILAEDIILTGANFFFFFASPWSAGFPLPLALSGFYGLTNVDKIFNIWPNNLTFHGEKQGYYEKSTETFKKTGS